MLVVTGVNGSGKTTLVKQVAIIVVLAQIGSFVPAAEAIIPIRDRLLSSLGSGDDMESNMSTFLAEMRRATYLLEHCTSRSLIVIDELGRGTATQDGAALSLAIAEALLCRSAFIFFVTHYRQLFSLSAKYGNVRQVRQLSSGQRPFCLTYCCVMVLVLTLLSNTGSFGCQNKCK